MILGLICIFYFSRQSLCLGLPCRSYSTYRLWFHWWFNFWRLCCVILVCLPPLVPSGFWLISSDAFYLWDKRHFPSQATCTSRWEKQFFSSQGWRVVPQSHLLAEELLLCPPGQCHWPAWCYLQDSYLIQGMNEPTWSISCHYVRVQETWGLGCFLFLGEEDN